MSSETHLLDSLSDAVDLRVRVELRHCEHDRSQLRWNLIACEYGRRHAPQQTYLALVKLTWCDFDQLGGYNRILADTDSERLGKLKLRTSVSSRLKSRTLHLTRICLIFSKYSWVDISADLRHA
jgi:hypothetical protein